MGFFRGYNTEENKTDKPPHCDGASGLLGKRDSKQINRVHFRQ